MITLTEEEAVEIVQMIESLALGHKYEQIALIIPDVLRAKLNGPRLPVAPWKEPSSAEIKALWNATKKPTEFATLLMAKIKEKNDVR
jgi:hypothetical protein